MLQYWERWSVNYASCKTIKDLPSSEDTFILCHSESEHIIVTDTDGNEDFVAINIEVFKNLLYEDWLHWSIAHAKAEYKKDGLV